MVGYDGVANAFLGLVREVLDERAWSRTSSPSQLLDAWEDLVSACEQGYDWPEDEHADELTTRDVLEAILTDPRTAHAAEARELGRRVHELDERYRRLLRDDVQLGPDHAPWWRRGILRRGGPEYVEDMRRIHGIAVDVASHDTVSPGARARD